ncbi:hypothetical protein LEP1GSC198_0579 [Leptospira kirschneri str. JB]|nr:hypothetical protein LEP1GSC198_0579 [Leptospira kirschneri str. JB]
MGHGQAEEVLRAAVGEAAAELVTAEYTVFMRILHFRKT